PAHRSGLGNHGGYSEPRKCVRADQRHGTVVPMIGPRVGPAARGPRVGPAVGVGADEMNNTSGVVVPFDGSTLIRNPTTEAEWQAPARPGPSWALGGQEPRGTLTDRVHGLVATVAGAGHDYEEQGPEVAYATKGTLLVDGTAGMGFTIAAGAGPDV